MLREFVLGGVLLLLSTSCKTFDDESLVLDNGFDKILDILDHAKIDGKELSGMTYRKVKGTEIELMIISDSSFKVLTINFEDKFATNHFYVDLKAVLPSEYRKGNSQWEAIARDRNHVFIMRENPGEIFVFNGDLKSFVKVVNLKVPKSSPLFDGWERDPNSRGEGMVLLSNGHILVVKEKDPVQLIEFGPKGDNPKGFDPGIAVATDGDFPLSSGTEEDFYPLKHWDVGDNSKSLISDVSDLTIGPDGKLYALSDKDARIAGLENVLKPSEEKFKVKSSWKLSPKVVKPEGMVINGRFEPLVTSDLSGFGKNLFLMKALD